jgi:hypothetical protein
MASVSAGFHAPALHYRAKVERIPPVQKKKQANAIPSFTQFSMFSPPE